jgi:hypothetical protein
MEVGTVVAFGVAHTPSWMLFTVELVSATVLVLLQILLLQSPSEVQPLPLSHPAHVAPPQSTSVSSSFATPSSQCVLSVGEEVGKEEGAAVGETVGDAVGAGVGTEVGAEVGTKVGAAVGAAVGAPVGTAVGATVGVGVGAIVGCAVGVAVGATVGVGVGKEVGSIIKASRTVRLLSISCFTHL